MNLSDIKDNKKGHDLLVQILIKMTPVCLTRAMRTCKSTRDVIEENRAQFRCYVPTKHLLLEIKPKAGMYGLKAESSTVTFNVECDVYNTKTGEQSKQQYAVSTDEEMTTFLETILPIYSIFRYGTIVFSFETERVMLRVMASLRKYNFHCDEVFYALCPSLPLVINVLRPVRIQSCFQKKLNMLDSSFKNTFDYTLDRLMFYETISYLTDLLDDIIRKTVRVELLCSIYRPETYPFIIKFMNKLVHENNKPVELWATLVGAPMPAKKLFNDLGEHLYCTSNQEIMVIVVMEDRIVVFQAIQDALKKSTNLIVRRHKTWEEFFQFYTQVTLDPNRHVLNKMLARYTDKLGKLKLK